MPTKLSAYFTFEELTVSQTAVRKGIRNVPGPNELANLTDLAKKLDEVRRLLGRPVLISSGFRCLEVNRAVGSKDSSSHIKGLAADFTCPGFGSVMDIFNKIKVSGVNFDQLIAEHPSKNGWVHLGIGPKMRRECLIYESGIYKPVI